CPPGRARRDRCRSPPGSPTRNPWLPTRTQATGDVRPRHSPTTPFVGPRTSSPPPDRRNRRASSERPNEVGLGDPSHGGGSLQSTELAREDVGGPVPTDPRPRTSARRHPQRGTCSGGSLFSLDDLGPPAARPRFGGAHAGTSVETTVRSEGEARSQGVPFDQLLDE